MTQIVVLHYPAERAPNWALLRAAARRRDLRLVSWAPHLIGLWCADGEQHACYAGKRARPGIVIHRTVAPFRGIAIPVLNCLAAREDGAAAGLQLTGAMGTYWYVRGLKIELRRTGSVPREPGPPVGDYPGQVLGSYDIERMRRWDDDRDPGIRARYLLDLVPLPAS